MGGDDLRRCLSYAPSIAALVVGFGYLFVPIDLIPDRLPVIGHLDEALFIVSGIALSFRLLPKADGRDAWMRRVEMLVVSSTMGGILFRLTFGRWPAREERRRFAAGLRPGRTPLPAVMRGMFQVPDGRTQVSRLLLLDMMRDGRLPRPEASGEEVIAIAPQIGDPLSFWEGKPVAFMHLEKTAGTALADLLTSRFHPLQIDPDPHRSMPPHLRCPFPDLVLPSVVRRELVWGHYDLPSLLRLGPDRVIVTMLRCPRARLLSLYRYWRSVDPSVVEGFGNHPLKLAQRLDLLDFLLCPDPQLRDMIDNVYVRRLAGLYASATDPDPLAADPADAVARARLAMRQVGFVGVVERIEESMAGLAAAVGSPLAETLPRRNVGDENAASAPRLFRAVPPSPVTPEIDAALEHLTRLDRVIYEDSLARLSRTTRRAA